MHGEWTPFLSAEKFVQISSAMVPLCRRGRINCVFSKALGRLTRITFVPTIGNLLHYGPELITSQPVSGNADIPRFIHRERLDWHKEQGHAAEGKPAQTEYPR